MEPRELEIIFTREYKSFISAFHRKSKEDYVLNINKILKDKFKTKFIVPNKVQAFLLNYETKKTLDKVVNIKNKKYKRIVYLNSNLSSPLILNAIEFIESQYPNVSFNYLYLESDEPEEEPISLPTKIKVILSS